jgi:hypothetical protein
MPGTELNVFERPPGRRKMIDCVELYLPKSIEFLSGLYNLLHEMLNQPLRPLSLDGFSIYEVDGVFRGQKTWEQRTLVIRLLLVRPEGHPAPPLEQTINALGLEVATKVAAREEEIWICHYPQVLTVFQGLKRILT